MDQAGALHERGRASSPNRLAFLTILLCWLTQFILLTAQMTVAESAAGLPILRPAELLARGFTSITHSAPSGWPSALRTGTPT